MPDKTRLAEAIWLHYYNRVLLSQGHITEREYRRMSLLIDNRKAAPPQRRSTTKA
jgi:hypothetical protein